MKSRDEECAINPTSEICRSFSYSAIARAIWYDDLRLARLLLERSNDAKKHIFIRQGKVILKEPAVFEAEMEDIKQRKLRLRLEQLESPVGSSQLHGGAMKQRRSCIHRLAKL